MFATALGGGILLDATLIRGVLAPAMVALLGRWNWWLPRSAARALHITAESAPASAKVNGNSGRASGAAHGLGGQAALGKARHSGPSR